MKNVLFLMALFLTVFGCAENKPHTAPNVVLDETAREAIIVETIDDFFDRVPLFKKDTILFMHTLYVDGHATPTLKNIKESGTVTDSVESDLIDDLLKYSDDTCNVVFDNFRVRNYMIFEDTPSNDKYLDSPKYFGSINFSKVAVNVERTNALYYLAINCGNACSKGFVIFLRWNGNSWKIESYINVWNS